MTRHRLVDRDDLLAGVSIVALLDQEVGGGRRNCWPCPSRNHAQTGRTPPVTADETQGLWCCHGCGAGGTALDLLMVAHDVTVADAFALLRKAGGLERQPIVPSTLKAAMPESAPPTDAADVLAAFCQNRGWRPVVAERCGLHVVTHRWGARPLIRFPFRWRGRAEWWQDRELGDRLPKFDSPAGATATVWAVDLAYGLESAHNGGQAILVEGPTDGVALAHIADPDRYPAVFALPGTGASGDLIGRLDAALAHLEVVILVDEDDPGEKFRARLHQLLRSAGSVIDVRVPAGSGDVDGWRRHLHGDDEALAQAIATQVELGVRA